jgi:autotransporter-associated beta strand protein
LDADTNYNTLNPTLPPTTSTVYSFSIPNTSSTGGVFSVVAGSTTLYIKTTQAGSPAANDQTGDLRGSNFTGWGVSYNNRSGGTTWANALAEGYKVEFFSNASLTTAAFVNSFGINIDDWGTCCTTVTSATPTGTTTGTGVYLVFDNSSTLNPLEVGTLTTRISGTEHFVGAIDDRNNNFQAVTLVPTGIGEYFGVGSTIYFSTVQTGSAVASSGVNTVTPSAVNITTTHGKTYANLGTTLNRVFDGGTLIIPIGAGATFTDLNAFAVNNVSGNTLQIDSGVSATFGGVFSGLGSITKTGTGTLTLSGINTMSGAFVIANGTVELNHASGNTLAAASSVQVDGTLDLTNTSASYTFIKDLSGSGSVIIATDQHLLVTDGSGTFSGVISGGAGTGGFEVGGGTQTLSGVNTYTGNTDITGGATLRLTGSGSIAAANTLYVSGTSGATFDISGISATGTTVNNFYSSTNGNVILGSKTLTINTTSNSYSNNSMVFSGTGGLTKTGTGTLTLSGANTYTGETTINAGSLTVSGSLSDSTAVSVASGASYNLGASDTVGSIAGAGTVALNSYTLTAGGLNTNTAVSGTITGTGGLTKTGTGTLTLTGVNTYSGATTIGAGTLMVGSSSSESTATIAGSTSVSLGSTLAGYGTVGAAGTTLTNSGTVAPGNSSIATLSVGGAYVQNSGGNLAIGLTPTTNDLLAVTEDATLAGTITVTGASGTYSPTRYTLVTSGGRAGTFDTLSTNIDTYTTLGYFLSYDDNNAYLTLGPDYINTTSALLRNFEQVKSVFASQAGLQISGLNYDCSTFGENNVCLSTGGRTSHVFNKSDAFDGQTPMMQSALLIGAYRIDPTIRLGGWIDQNINTQNANIKMSNPIPMFGIFGVYDPSGNNTEWQLKASASYSEKDLNITRQQLQNTEAGFGKTTFKGLAAQLDLAYAFSDLVPNTFVSPTVGVRYYSGHTNDYSEESTSTVQVPVSYNKFKEASGVAFAGLKLDGDILPQLRYSASAGVETDIKRNNPTYSGSSSIFGLSSFNLQGNSSPRDTRAYANAGLGYIIDKTQSINFGVYYREDQFRNIESFSSILTYTIGL